MLSLPTVPYMGVETRFFSSKNRLQSLSLIGYTEACPYIHFAVKSEIKHSYRFSQIEGNLMAKKAYTPNFPDILGDITGNQRVNIGLVQVAMAIRQRILRAGRPFEVILLVQNSSDIAIDFVARVRLPERDANGKKGRFVNKVDKLVIGLEPAQVGYLTLPVSSLPDTAVSADYKMALEVKMKPASNNKPRRIRLEAGGGEVDTEHLAEGVVDKIEELKHLNWTAKKVSGMRSTGLEVGFGLMGGTIGKLTDLKPGWESLWTIANLSDITLLLEKHRAKLLKSVLPTLTPERIFPRAYDTTLANFEEAGFKLSKWEAIVIAKMMTLILLFADPSKLMELIAGNYNSPYAASRISCNSFNF
jgi:hypothetical protein